jgi:hypothetical protein
LDCSAAFQNDFFYKHLAAAVPSKQWSILARFEENDPLNFLLNELIKMSLIPFDSLFYCHPQPELPGLCPAAPLVLPPGSDCHYPPILFHSPPAILFYSSPPILLYSHFLILTLLPLLQECGLAANIDMRDQELPSPPRYRSAPTPRTVLVSKIQIFAFARRSIRCCPQVPGRP